MTLPLLLAAAQTALGQIRRCDLAINPQNPIFYLSVCDAEYKREPVIKWVMEDYSLYSHGKRDEE